MTKQAILCVDDEEMVLDSLEMELSDSLGANIVFEFVSSGEEALEVMTELISDGFNIPLVISDYIMPKMKGDELLEKIHQEYPHTLSILLTGQADLSGVIHVVNHAQLFRFIAKPWIPKDLLMTVKQAVNSFDQQQKILTQNLELQELNSSLERKVKERTEEVIQQKEVIERKNQDITDSIAYAQRIQEAMLPRVSYIQKFLPDSFIFLNLGIL